MRGDRILALDGVAVANWNELDDLVREGELEVLPLSLERGGSVFEAELRAGEDGWGFMPLLDNRVGKVLRGGPADEAGIRRGDRILQVDGRGVSFFNDIAEIVNERPGEEISIVWEREGQRREALVTVESAAVPTVDGGSETIGRIFFEPFMETRELGWGESLAGGAAQVTFYVAATVDFLLHLPSQGASVGGPILIFRTAGEMAGWGFERLLIFIAFFSTQLCLLNLLPIPVLDGGHVLLLIPEIFGLKVGEKLRLRLTQAGMMLLLGIMVLVVPLDLRRLFGG
jgi:regulator of sigma E protease